MTVQPSRAPDALRLLASAPAGRLTELPRPPRAGDRGGAGDPAWRLRFAGVVAAYHGAISAGADVPLVIGWRREQATRPIDFYVGGAALSATGPGRAATIVPPGGLGRMLPEGRLLTDLAAVPWWVRIGGSHDGMLSRTAPGGPAGAVRLALADGLLRVWREPFAWVLIAEPLTPSWVAAEATRVGELERDSRNRDSPVNAIRSARLGSRHEELRRAESTGLWRVHLLAGGESPGAAAGVGALVTAAADLADLPYALATRSDAGPLTSSLAAPAPSDRWETPFVAGSELLTALIPALTTEIPGTRLTLRSTFDTTPETGTVAGSIRLGRVLDQHHAETDDLALARESLNRHTFVAGATGAGKSQTIRALLAAATEGGLPWLVVEPAKAEYKLMAARLGAGSVITIRPGGADLIPAGINPLEPAPGFSLQAHADMVRALFTASFQSEQPFPQVLAAALARCYEGLGWDLALGEPATAGLRPRYPTLADLQRVAEQVVLDTGYGPEVRDNILGFIRIRIASLRLGSPGRFLEGGHPIDFAALLRRNVVFEIEDAGDDQDKAFLIGTVLIRLVEHLRVRQRAREHAPVHLEHLSVFEEAHRLLRNSQQAGSAAHAVELFASLLAEIRAYGEGLVIAEQIPAKLTPDVIKNTAVKIVHRLPARDDRDAVGATMNLTREQSEYLVTLTPGTAALYTDGMDYPLLVRMPDGTGTEAVNPAITADPGEVIGRRSPSCPAECRTTACTLREMRAAQRLPDRVPWLRLWAELSVLAHLTGWPIPLPLGHVWPELLAVAPRLRGCAVSHAVDAAVHARGHAIAATHSPGDLATHVTEAMLGRSAGRPVCAMEEPRWLAAPYRWSLVFDALKDLRNEQPDAGRHPRSREWETAHHRPIPGATVADQFVAVRSWFEADLRDAEARRTIAFGGTAPSAIETAVGVSRSAPEWNERLTDGLSVFHPAEWPHRYLGP
ncbi:ATP-binding protein [Actinoplanes sp. NPDC049265]|uniref:ATP-binding protein n=1 Tax=Actinoplanes sp. NPDC049265 TaxID=3363902 RepID=UPI0037235EBF